MGEAAISEAYSYGECEDELPDDGAAPDDPGQSTSELVVSNARCSKCGASDHRRPTSKLCPHFKGRALVSNQVADDHDTSSGREVEDSLCICGGNRAHSRACPVNPRNLHK